MIKNIVLKLLSIFDYFYQRKILIFLKKNNLDNFDVFFDVGAHKGESIELFLKEFKIKNFYSFEASPINYKILNEKVFFLKKKFKDVKIILENIALSSSVKKIYFKQSYESSSSTLSEINEQSKYFLKKKAILNFFSNKDFYNKIEIQTNTLKNYINENHIKQIDFLKIDTEGYEYEIILGLEKKINKVKLVMFEHHYDDMIKKTYKYSDIKKILNDNNFVQIYKIKMPFRKTFEYIFINTNKT
jgi:FkbM family methyltransferase